MGRWMQNMAHDQSWKEYFESWCKQSKNFGSKKLDSKNTTIKADCFQGKSNAPEGNQTNTATPLTSSSTDDKSAAEPPKSAEQEQVENEIMDLESWYWTTRRPST